MVKASNLVAQGAIFEKPKTKKKETAHLEISYQHPYQINQVHSLQNDSQIQT